MKLRDVFNYYKKDFFCLFSLANNFISNNLFINNIYFKAIGLKHFKELLDFYKYVNSGAPRGFEKGLNISNMISSIKPFVSKLESSYCVVNGNIIESDYIYKKRVK